jgi:nitroimidazol reductase NimA-like FMN-containing flavoprotein (pyridoxamine 5'-phosphate oxidase superfamily)
MASNGSSEAYGAVRRYDRVMDDAWIQDFLARAPYLTLATVSARQPFLIPLNFVFDRTRRAVYVHKASAGQTLVNLRANENVCLCAAAMGRLLPAAKAGQFSVEYASVVAFGAASIIANEGEVRHALEGLLTKYFPGHKPGRDYTALTVDDLRRPTVVRVDIDHWTGKAHRESREYPGAFLYPERSVMPGSGPRPPTCGGVATS